MKKQINIESVVEDNTALIILDRTGIHYTAQCGGLACTHPEAEGFVINLGVAYGLPGQECDHLCITSSHEEKMRLADEYDAYFPSRWGNPYKLKLTIDRTRMDEMQEGWIPVRVTGQLDPFTEMVFNSTEAVLHTGNCD